MAASQSFGKNEKIVMVRILFLGGAYHQIPIIKEAKNRGFYIITCDYLPSNPGHKLADEYFNVSTTDMDAVLKLAKKVKPDFIIAYASDLAAPVAAYISEKLGLPGSPYESTRNLAEKDLFRNFQKERGFNVPDTMILTENDNAFEKLTTLKFPFIIKPTDSSGSKGVSKVTFPDEINSAVKYALSFSRKKMIIAEEFIDNKLADIHGDGFVIEGELVFSFLGDHIYNTKSNPFNPVGTIWPSSCPQTIIEQIQKDVASIIKGSGFKCGAINIEARVNSKGKHFIMEMGPRSGGHHVPQAIQYATGFDMVKASLDVLMGKPVIIPEQPHKYSAYYAVHTDADGILVEFSFKDEIIPFIKEFHQYKLPGDQVNSFTGAGDAIGIIIFVFDSSKEMLTIMRNIKEYYLLEIH